MFQTCTVRIADAAYPQLLREIPQPPKTLYCRGDVSLLSHAHLLAIVGSRKASAYGKQVVHNAVFGVVPAGVVTVSGLAFGIDQATHEETLACGGKTIAVLGSPVERSEIAPQSNLSLAEHILESGGLLVSEYPSGTSVYPSSFPARNRIIAGISHAALVVEASLKSGALITARFAVECGRDVYAVPGSIFSPVSVGTNGLIERGAIPWLSCASFLGEIEYGNAGNAVASLSEDEQRVYTACADAPHSVEQIVDATGLSAAVVMQCVTMLTIYHHIRDLGDSTYVHV